MKRSETIVLLPNDIEVGIESLDPDALKRGVARARRRYRKGDAKTATGALAGLTTLQNDLARALGPFRSFELYRKAWVHELKEFMEANGLLAPADLVSTRRIGRPGRKDSASGVGTYSSLGGRIRLVRQAVSERLFLSGEELPTRLFTGYDFDFWNSFEDGPWILATDLCKGGRESPHGLRAGLWSAEDLRHNVDLALDDDGTLVEIDGRSDHPRRQLVDVVLGGHSNDMCGFYHLRGDALLAGAACTVEHAPGESDDPSDLQLLQRLFRRRIEDQSCGWVDVLPFRDRLIFLRGSDGEYDFLVRNERQRRFDTRVYGPDLPARNVSSSNSDYRFEHWLHFRHEGWREKELHEAEVLHSRSAPDNLPIPFGRAVLTRYYRDAGLFVSETRGVRHLATGFRDVVADGRHIAFRDLVTIQELFDFLQAPETAPRPCDEEPLRPVNSESDMTLPASATWNVAMTYAKYLGTRLGLPLRLPTLAEHLALRKAAGGRPMRNPWSPATQIEEAESNAPAQEPSPLLLHFLTPDGEPYAEHPPYMAVEKFNALRLVYRAELRWLRHENGLRIVNSAQFAEWVQERQCVVGCGTAIDPHCGIDVLLARVGGNSTGKYKGFKTGIRLCYEILPDG